MMPKKKKLSFDVNPPKLGREYLKYGMERIEELLINTDKKTNYLPRTIGFFDMDNAINEFIVNNIDLVLDDEKVPVFYLENERWGEFRKTWKFMDKDKNVPTPYVTIRRSGKEKGTRLGNRFNIPEGHFTYLDVPILDEGQVINLRFKIPQPTNVDLIYDLRLFTKYREDVNKMDEIIMTTFDSRQNYVFIKGNPMPVVLESINEANTIENIDGDRYYVPRYNIKIQGFIQKEENFEITKTSRKPDINIDLR